MYPTRLNRLRYWIARHILRLDTPYMLVGAIYCSPLLEAVEKTYNTRHECSFVVTFSETTYSQFSVRVELCDN